MEKLETPVATNNNDVLSGTSVNDVINGTAGDDTRLESDGNDRWLGVNGCKIHPNCRQMAMNQAMMI